MTYRLEITLELPLDLRSVSDLNEEAEDGIFGETERRWDWAGR